MIHRLKKIFILLFVSFNLFGQNTDSLKLAFKNAKHDTTRCYILEALIENETSDELWQKYGWAILKITDKALDLDPSEKLRIAYTEYKAYALNVIGQVEANRGNINKAMDLYKEGLKLQEEVNDDAGIAASLNSIGFLYNDLGDIPKALECYHKSLRIGEKLNDKGVISTLLNNIGLIYQSQYEGPKALEYFTKCLKICEEIKDDDGIKTALLNIGGVYYDLNDIPKALEYYYKSSEICKAINDMDGVAAVLNNIGMVHWKKNNLKESVNSFQEALKIQEGVSQKSDISITSCNIANIKFQQGFTDEALPYALKSYSIAIAIGYPEQIGSAAMILKDIYHKQNKHKEAFEMYELQIKMRDSINNEETERSTIKKQFQYAYEKQAAQDSVKHAEAQKVTNAQLLAQEAEFTKEKTQRVVLYGGLALLLAGSGLVFNRFRLTQKQKQIIQQQKEQVGFAYDQLHSKNKEVMDSINYASRIQNSLLPTEKYISKILDKNK
mgnify:CR=1 FL=1